jgi:hypothetical protein
MKKIFRNNRIIAFALLTVFSTVATSAVRASENPVVPVELKYVGVYQNQPVFQLLVNGSPEQNEFTIVIRDEFGNSLYRENINAESFSKKFLVNTDEIGDETLHFEVTSRKIKQTVKFEVNRNSRFIQEVAINKVK